MKESYEIETVVAEVGTIGPNFGLAIQVAKAQQIFLFTPCCRNLHAHPTSGETVLGHPLLKTECLDCGLKYSINFYGTALQARDFCTSISSERSVKRAEQWVQCLTSFEVSLEVEMVL